MANTAQAISNLDQTISSFKARVDVKVDNVNKATANIQATTDQIYSNINRFKTQMVQGEEKEIAHENILRIDQIIKEQFSSYETIRRTVMGIVRDFDINLVRNSTIQELSEELWITSSRYWLSYAMIAITAWVNDYPEVAKNALAESGRKDAIRTTLFFCLLNFRFNRIDSAKKWFREYIKTLDPRILQNETAILLQSFLNGVFGKDKELEHGVIELIDEWVTIINEDAEISNELIIAYETFIDQQTPTLQFNYRAVLTFCLNSNELQASHYNVSKFSKLLEFVKSLDVDEDAQTDENYKSRIDAILIDLISNYDSEELELRKQQDYYRFIVESNGVVEQAEDRYKAMEKLENESFNIGKQMVKWVIYDDNNQTNIQVRKFGLINTKRWFKMAVNNFDIKLHENYPTEYKLRIDVWDGTSTGNDQAEQINSMKTYYKNHKFQLMYVNKWNMIAAIIFILSATLAFITPFSLIITGLCAGFLAFRVIQAIKKFPIRVKAALSNLTNCMNEITEFKRYYEEKRNEKQKLLSIVEFI